LRAGINLDLEKYADAAREFVASGTREERGAILGEVMRQTSPESVRLMEEFALRSDFREDEAHMLARAGTLGDARVADKLFGLLLRSTDWSKPFRTIDLVQALANYPASDVSRHGTRLVEEFPSASSSARLAILSGLWRFGETGERLLIQTARTPGDGVEQIAAWNALTWTPRFSTSEELQREAKEFLSKRDPNLFGAPPDKWRSSLGADYLNLVAQTYLVAGAESDIPMLEKMWANPRVPFTSHPEVMDVCRMSVRTAIDAIRLRQMK